MEKYPIRITHFTLPVGPRPLYHGLYVHRVGTTVTRLLNGSDALDEALCAHGTAALRCCLLAMQRGFMEAPCFALPLADHVVQSAWLLVHEVVHGSAENAKC